jgi:beta-1,4-mannosyltransferase
MALELASTRRDVERADMPRPSWAPFVLAVTASLVALAWFSRYPWRPGFVSWYATVVWTLPLPIVAQGIAGIRRVRRRWDDTRFEGDASAVRCRERLIVVLPSVGRRDTLPGLSRVLDSLTSRLPRHFDDVRVDIVVDEGSEALCEMSALAVGDGRVRLLVVPADFRTPHGTRFKARANQYALDCRLTDGETGDDTWILHMDDDTGISASAAEHLAAFVNRQLAAAARDEPRRHLAQGILAYPREYSQNRLTWYADAVRTGCDLSFFVATTGRGSPRTGLHGELLLIRSSIEAEIGWDFGPSSIVEDAQFALLFCERHPGASDWFPSWCEGASPTSPADFVRQRERWVWGLLSLLREPAIPLRRRLVLLPTLVVWVLAPISNLFVLLLIATLLGDLNSKPAIPALGVAWSVNFGFYVWLYWQGFKVNARASSPPGARWWEGPAIVLLTPVFCLLECLGTVFGVAQFMSRRNVHFTVIGKPA